MKKPFIVCLLALVLVAFGGVIYHMAAGSGNTPSAPATTTSSTSDSQGKEAKPATSKEEVTPISKISSNMKGKTITTRGVVTDVSGQDTVHFKLKDVNSSNKIDGVMFKKTNSDNADRVKLLQKSAKSKQPVYVEGEVDVYKGNLEIKLWKVYTDK